MKKERWKKRKEERKVGKKNEAKKSGRQTE